MGRIVVFMSLTLDGVMQAPGRSDEDRRGGFEHGGWAAPYAEPGIGKAASASMKNTGALLLGRRTYEDFYSVWVNRADNPFTEILNNAQKYVASTTLKEPLPWINSTLIKGNVAEAVAQLRAQSSKDIVILGSGVLVRSLMRHNLIDEYTLLIHPLALGAGQQLFVERGEFMKLQLINAEPSSTGVMVTTYRSDKTV